MVVVVRLQGGLGNQMFQYALGRALSARNDAQLILDLTFLLDRTPRGDFMFRNYELGAFGGVSPEFTRLSRIALKLPAPAVYFRLTQFLTYVKDFLQLQTYVREGIYEFQPHILTLQGDVYLDGYWQSSRYFDEIEALLRHEFTVLPPDDQDVQALGKEIECSESVAVHIRRGDLVSVPSSIQAHGFVGLAYFAEGMSEVARRTEKPVFYLFSDDIRWCMKNVVTAYPHVFVVHGQERQKSITDLWLMSRCRHFIVSNSTFAWWAVWMSDSEEKIVVAPRVWAREREKAPKELIPSSWIRI